MPSFVDGILAFLQENEYQPMNRLFRPGRAVKNSIWLAVVFGVLWDCVMIKRRKRQARNHFPRKKVKMPNRPPFPAYLPVTSRAR
jgi:hypothetical protein